MRHRRVGEDPGARAGPHQLPAGDDAFSITRGAGTITCANAGDYDRQRCVSIQI